MNDYEFYGKAIDRLDDIRDGQIGLRDYFAAKALTGLIGRAWQDDRGNVPANVMDMWAAAAYKTADAMLAAREQTP